MRLWRSIAMACLAIAVVASVVLAQRPRGEGGGFRAYGNRFRMSTLDDYDGSFQFCRIVFRGNVYGDGGNWSVDWPRADINLSFRLSELTSVIAGRDEGGEYKHLLLRLTDPLLFHCPFIMMTEVGNSFFDDSEAEALRTYLQKGGFLWADDFWGTRAWEVWNGEIRKALPADRYSIVDLPMNHELFHMLYDMKRMPQIPSIGFFFGSGGRTSERGSDSAEPHARAIFDEQGRIMVLISYNTDFGDAFEREGDNYQYFLTFAPEGYAFGVNALLYSMTH